MNHNVPVQSLINHIKTAIDVDPWAKEMVEELLKGQEPHVLTLEEVLGGDECWFEYINGYCGHVNAYMQDNKTTIIYRTNVRPVEVLITDYMKKWRCWSDRPTEEKRKEVKWDAPTD